MDIQQFKLCFEAGKLGRLYYPQQDLNIRLDYLYKLLSDWRPNGEVSLNLNEIFGVITFGQAIDGYQYEAVGKLIEGKPHNSDFLALGNDIISRYTSMDSVYSYEEKFSKDRMWQVPKLETGGFYIHFRNAHYMDGFIKQSISQGAIVLQDSRLTDFMAKHKIPMPKKQVVWDVNGEQNLEGRII